MRTPITPDLTVNDLADLWLRKLRSDGRLESTTVNEYQRVLRTLVEPRVGHKRLDELTTEHVNELLDELGQRSRNRQRKAKVVFGAMLDFAVNEGALLTNPVRGSLSISRPPAAPPTLKAAQMAQIHAALRTSRRKERPGPRSEDIGDIIEVMLGAGARIGEVLALRWSDVDLDTRTLSINATIKTAPGEGTYRKTLARPRLVALPEYTALLLGKRRRVMPENLLDAVFPTRNETWQQVNNVERRWRQIRSEAGLDWITPDMFRRGVTYLAEPFER